MANIKDVPTQYYTKVPKKGYRCTICDKEVPHNRLFNMKKRIMDVHMADSFSCPTCGNKFARSERNIPY